MDDLTDVQKYYAVATANNYLVAMDQILGRGQPVGETDLVLALLPAAFIGVADGMIVDDAKLLELFREAFAIVRSRVESRSTH